MGSRKQQAEHTRRGDRISPDRNALGIAIGDAGVAMALCRVNDAGGLYPFSFHTAGLPNKWEGVPTIEELEQTVGLVYERIRHDCWTPFRSVFLCLPSWNLKKREFQYELPITPPFSEVTQQHVNQLMELIHQVAVTGSDVVVDIVPQFYLLDNVKKVLDPTGMVAEKMELHALLIVTDRGTMQSLLEMLKRLNLHVNDIVSPHVAAGKCVLTDDEQEAGVVLVDIGQSNTCCSYFYGGRLFNIHVIPIGGRAISIDIARTLQTSCNRVEVLADRKKELLLLPSNPNGSVSLPSFGDQDAAVVSLREIDHVIGYSIERLLAGLIESLQIAQGYMDFATAGMVFIGENSLALRGILEVAKRRIDMPIRLGYPLHIDTMSSPGISTPSNARLLGLIRHSFGRRSENASFLGHFYETPVDHLKQEIKGMLRRRILRFIDRRLGQR